MKNKFCINCKWQNGIYCKSPKIPTELNPVTGESKPWLNRCESHRTGYFTSWLGCRLNGLCGKEGRWFEAKTQRAAAMPNIRS